MLKVEFLTEFKSKLADIAEIQGITLFVMEGSKLVVCSAAFDQLLMLKVLGTVKFPSIEPTHPMWQTKGKNPEEMAELLEQADTWRAFFNASKKKLDDILLRQSPADEPEQDDVWQQVARRHQLSVGLAVDGRFLACEGHRISPVELIGPNSLIDLLQAPEVPKGLKYLEDLQMCLDIARSHASESEIAASEVQDLELEMSRKRSEIAGFLCMGGLP